MRRAVYSPVTGSVWTHAASVGQRVAAGEQLLVVESMKTEFGVEASVAGVVIWLRPCGEQVDADVVVAIVETAT